MPTQSVYEQLPWPIRAIATNLFLTVVHAFPGGQAGHIDIKVEAAGNDGVKIVFSDDGCGMNLDIRRKAFDPFFTTRRDQGSTGLGLHIVHSIVTNCLGGRLNLDSAPDKGTRIQLILPRDAPIASRCRPVGCAANPACGLSRLTR